MAVTQRLLVLTLSLVTAIEAGSVCQYAYNTYTNSGGTFQSHTHMGAMYCEEGCCGDRKHMKCCSDDDGNLEAIVTGGVIGGLLFIAVVAGIITCYCHYKMKAKSVIQPSHHHTEELYTLPSSHNHGYTPETMSPPTSTMAEKPFKDFPSMKLPGYTTENEDQPPPYNEFRDSATGYVADSKKGHMFSKYEVTTM